MSTWKNCTFLSVHVVSALKARTLILSYEDDTDTVDLRKLFCDEIVLKYIRKKIIRSGVR